MSFKDLKVGKPFRYNGSTYVKKSSRTAYLLDMYSRWFYFSHSDIVSLEIPAKGTQDTQGYY